MSRLNDFFKFIKMEPFHVVEGHFSFKAITKVLPDCSPIEFCEMFSDYLNNGGFVIPTFTYNFKKIAIESEKFDKRLTPSKVGLVSDVIWRLKSSRRTSSPTHSFAIGGKELDGFDDNNNPVSPLGLDSPLSFVYENENSYALLIGVNFTSFSFIHFLEVLHKVPYADIFPWINYGIYNVGVSVDGEIQLKETPGCSKSFFSLEEFCLRRGIINYVAIDDVKIYYFNIKEFVSRCGDFFRNDFARLLCDTELCQPCSFRRKKLKEKKII